MDIWLHPSSRHQLEALKTDLPQSLLLTGKYGVGLGTIAMHIAGGQLEATIQPENSKGKVDEHGTITVEAIRRLYDQTRTKQNGRRIIVIDNAQRMSKGAQSAFLKLLEEPNATTHFILTSHEPNLLLPTIRSRVQQQHILPLTPEQTSKFIASCHITDTKKITQLQFIASGLPAEILRLLSDPKLFEVKAKIIADARTLLQADVYQRMKLIHAYRTSREDALQLLDGAMAIINHSLRSKPQPLLFTQLAKLLQAKEQVAANHSIVLTLTNIVL